MKIKINKKENKILVNISVKSKYDVRGTPMISLTKWSIAEILRDEYNLNVGVCLKESKINNVDGPLSANLEYENLDYKPPVVKSRPSYKHKTKKQIKKLDISEKSDIIKIEKQIKVSLDTEE